MNNAFSNLDDEIAKVPDHVKTMLVAEIDTIRDSLNVANMFMGEFMLTFVKMIQETQPEMEED